MQLRTRNWWGSGVLTFFALAVPLALMARAEVTVEQLKDRVANASIAERASLCIQIAERQLENATRLHAAGDSEQAQAALVDVVAFSGLARDYAIQAHKREKQSEIAIRKMSRKLSGLKHTVSHDDQKGIQDTIDQLEKIRDDLLAAMFPNGVKK
jgi:hypothetical protein